MLDAEQNYGNVKIYFNKRNFTFETKHYSSFNGEISVTLSSVTEMSAVV